MHGQAREVPVAAPSDEDYVAYVTARLPALKRLAYLLCGDDHRADDVVQESITKLYLHWESARKADHLDGYVRAIVVRTYIDEGRRSWSRVRLFGSVPDRPRVLESTGEDRAVLRAALSRLPARQRAVLVLRFLCDLPINEVGELLGCSPGTVKSQTAHGLAKMRQVLGGRDLAATAGGGRDGTQ
jgi:RNA polymerase sigma-70 factor (sigma-E family)